MIPITLSAKEASQLLGVSYWLLLDMAKRKEVPHIRAGKKLLFRKESLLNWLSEQEEQSVQPPVRKTEFGSLRKIEL